MNLKALSLAVAAAVLTPAAASAAEAVYHTVPARPATVAPLERASLEAVQASDTLMAYCRTFLLGQQCVQPAMKTVEGKDPTLTLELVEPVVGDAVVDGPWSYSVVLRPQGEVLHVFAAAGEHTVSVRGREILEPYTGSLTYEDVPLVNTMGDVYEDMARTLDTQCYRTLRSGGMGPDCIYWSGVVMGRKLPGNLATIEAADMRPDDVVVTIPAWSHQLVLRSSRFGVQGHLLAPTAAPAKASVVVARAQ